MTAQSAPALTPPPMLRTTAVPAVTVGELSKRFDTRPVLRAVSFSLNTGETLALLGPNGVGKTTLLRVLATLIKPSSGGASVDSLDVVRDAAQVRRVVGYVGHQPHLYEDLTARENLLFFARMYGMRDGRACAADLLERVGLTRRANDLVRTLSRGQTQRLALARGVLHEPSLLLLDEPDTGLDDEAGVLLDDLIRERGRRAQTTIFTTHHIERGLLLSERALVLAGGRVAYSGPSQALDVAGVRGYYDHAGRVRA